MLNKKSILGLVGMALLLAQPLVACDVSAFVQSEFSERCQKLIDFCEKARTAFQINHPDTDKRISEVSRDWIDFYLSHGNSNVQPPNMTFIKPEIWNRALKELGYCFSSFIHKKLSDQEYQKMLLTINCFKDEENLQNLHNSFKASELSEKTVNKIADIDEWLICRLHGPFEKIYKYAESYPDIVSDVRNDIEWHIDSIRTFCKLTEGKSDEVKQSYFDTINKSLQETLEKWEVFFMYK